MYKDKRGIRALVKAITEFMESHEESTFSINEVAKGINATWRTAEGNLKLLVDLGYVQEVKVNNRVQYGLVANAVKKEIQRLRTEARKELYVPMREALLEQLNSLEGSLEGE